MKMPIDDFFALVCILIYLCGIPVFNFIYIRILRKKINLLEKRIIFLEGKVDSKKSTNND